MWLVNVTDFYEELKIYQTKDGYQKGYDATCNVGNKDKGF